MIRKELKALVKAVETKEGKSIPISSDFEKLAQIFSKYHISLQPLALKKVWTYVTGAEKPSTDVLDKLALFVGFQSWKDFQNALHGDDDGQTNYDV